MGAFKNQLALILWGSVFICYSCSKTSNNRLSEAGNDWPVYLGGKSSSHYSPLRQIDRNNLSRLKVAWQYHSGEKEVKNLSQIQTNPLVIDGSSMALPLD